jgi:hypothetical protein
MLGSWKYVLYHLVYKTFNVTFSNKKLCTIVSIDFIRIRFLFDTHIVVRMLSPKNQINLVLDILLFV